MEIESEKCKFKFCIQLFAFLFLHIMTKCRRNPVAFVSMKSVINILLCGFEHNLANQSYNHAELSLVWNKAAENVTLQHPGKNHYLCGINTDKNNQ